jgi:predicted phage terminase large subunit-like protein
MSDKNAESATITKDIRNIIYKAARQALHPKKRKINWTGTPFNARDPLYQAAGSESWNTRVYPICEKFPCTREEFVGAWEDRFSYDFVKKEYYDLLANGEINAFNQELMLRIMSEEDRLVSDGDIEWYMRKDILENKNRFNFYVTTDFATSTKDASDNSVIAVWAYNSAGDWFWVDGIVKRQLMDKNINDLFRLCQKYRPQQVGIEVSGQQGGFIPWIQREMMTRNIWFTLASENNTGAPGIRPNTNKMARFQVMLPMFKMNKMYFPHERKTSQEIVAFMDELSLASLKGFKSKHDDCIDAISMLGSLTPWKPSEAAAMSESGGDGIWALDEMEEYDSGMDSYIV